LSQGSVVISAPFKEIDNEELTLSVSFFPDGRIVAYKRDDITDLDLAYAITIHKSQGSEFEAVIIPVLNLFRKLNTIEFKKKFSGPSSAFMMT
jgi:hypothetical protein